MGKGELWGSILPTGRLSIVWKHVCMLPTPTIGPTALACSVFNGTRRQDVPLLFQR